jgi:spore maturation protein CgeB
MNILLITSGYKGIYPWLERWVFTEISRKEKAKLFHIKNGLKALKFVCKSFRPHAVVVLGGLNIPQNMLSWLNRQNLKTAVWFTEDPYFMDYTKLKSKEFAYVFTIDSAALEIYQNQGHTNAYHLPLGTNTEVFKPKFVETKFKSDICIVGYPYPERIKYIEFLLQHTQYIIQAVGEWKRHLSKIKEYTNLKVHNGWAAPNVVAEYYNGAKIVLNSHRPFNLEHNKNVTGVVGKSINNRTFDIAACRAFQLIQTKEDLPLHFNVGEEIVSFNSFEDLLIKTRRYIEVEEERNRIANNAWKRVLSGDTFEHRVEKMLNIIQQEDIKK